MKFIIFLFVSLMISFGALGQSKSFPKAEFWNLLKNNKIDDIYNNQDDYSIDSSMANSKEDIAILVTLQYINKEFNDYERALQFESIIFNGHRRMYGYESKEMYDHLFRLSEIYTLKSDFNHLLEIEPQIILIAKIVYSENSREYVQSIINYSITLNEIGLFKLSLGQISLAIEIAQKHNYEALEIQALISHGSTFFAMGQNAYARDSYSKAIEIIRKSENDYLKRYRQIITNMIAVCLSDANTEEAQEYAKISIELSEYIFGINSNEYNNSKIQAANISFINGDMNLAIKEYRKSLRFLKKTPHLSYLYLSTLNNFALSHYNINRIHKSKIYFNKALKLTELLYGADHPEYSRILFNISHCLFKSNKYEESIELSFNSFESSFKNFIDNRSSLSVKDQLIFKSLSVYRFYSICSMLSQYNRREYISRLFWNWARLKNIVSETGTMDYNFQPFQGNSIIESSLKSSFNPYSILDNNEVFIDIFPFEEYDFSKNRENYSIKYLAFIINSKDTLVDYILIKDGSFLDEDVYDAYKHGVTQAKSELKNSNFYNRLWKPIADKIGDAKKVYISLGGVYNKINLNTIYNPNTEKYLMEELDIQIVNSARDFVLMKEKKQKKYKSNVAVLFGYPDFDSNQKEEDTKEELAYSRDLAAFWIDSLNRGGHRASPLPGTKTEIETIDATMSKNNWEVRSFMQEQASERNFKKQHSPRVLHVATHGYFFEDIPMENDQMRFMGMDRERVVQDPMLRSGLLLAGANKALSGDESEEENGLLSASEASLLDLSETELVVLSACETGRGEIKNSEGVYGLRKAFSNAGAENTIMSLWKVDDKVTQEFMTTFYTYWLEDKMSIREAFKSTRSFIKSKYPQPYYWGAFILVGR